MGRRHDPRPRSDGRNGANPQSPGGRDDQHRIMIAQTAARLIVEHGIADWTMAKRKAARQLMLGEREPLPADHEVAQALVEHHALFGGDAHRAQLARQRTEALRWMRRLAAFKPELAGGVAAGWATAHSDIRLELVADDPKAVELRLVNEGVDYRAMRTDKTAGADGADLYIPTSCGGLRLVIRSATAARQRPRREAHSGRHDGDEVRYDADALAQLLGEVSRPSASAQRSTRSR